MHTRDTISALPWVTLRRAPSETETMLTWPEQCYVHAVLIPIEPLKSCLGGVRLVVGNKLVLPTLRFQAKTWLAKFRRARPAQTAVQVSPASPKQAMFRIDILEIDLELTRKHPKAISVCCEIFSKLHTRGPRPVDSVQSLTQYASPCDLAWPHRSPELRFASFGSVLPQPCLLDRILPMLPRSKGGLHRRVVNPSLAYSLPQLQASALSKLT